MDFYEYSKTKIIDEKREKFMRAAKKLHGDKYDFTDIDYVNSITPIKLRCKLHNISFTVLPTLFVKRKRSGCPVCRWMAVSNTQEEFLRRARAVHGDTYLYDKVKYVAYKKRVIITCRKHGDFLQRPSNHVEGQGCMKCVNEAKRKRFGKVKVYSGEIADLWLNKLQAKYPWLKFSEFSNPGVPCKVTCDKHGEMYVTAYSMLRSDGVACKYCARNMSEKKEKYLAKARELHGDQYDYSKFDFSENPATFICKKHGEFKQSRRGHIETKIPCRECERERRRMSKEEFLKRARDKFGDYYDYSKTNFVDTRTNVKIICPKHGIFIKKAGDHIRKPRYPGDKIGGCQLCIAAAKFEVIAIAILNKNKIKYKHQFMFDDFRYKWDFMIPDLKFVIEIDESSHKGKNLHTDGIKDMIMESRGYKTYRISVKTTEEILNFESRFKKALAHIIRYKIDNKLFSNVLDLAAYLNLDKNAKLSKLEQYKFKPL